MMRHKTLVAFLSGLVMLSGAVIVGDTPFAGPRGTTLDTFCADIFSLPLS